MPAGKRSKRLVIDASVARSAGGRENPTSQRCTDFLMTLREETEHALVMTPDIFAEWQKHESFFTTAWRKSMVAKKRAAFFRADVVVNPDLREKIYHLDVSDTARREMLKDVPLLEAALASDRTVASLNEGDRKRFANACEEIAEIQGIVWVNPDKPEQNCPDWLREGAPAEPHRMLGYQEE